MSAVRWLAPWESGSGGAVRSSARTCSRTPSPPAGPSAPSEDSGSNDIFLAGLQGAQPRVQCWRSREGGETFGQQRSDGLLDGERGASGGEGGGDDGVGAQVHGQVPRLPRGGGELGGLELLSTSGCLMSTCHLQDFFTEPHLCPESPKVRRQRIRHAGAAGELSLIAFLSLNKARHWLEEALGRRAIVDSECIVGAARRDNQRESGGVRVRKRRLQTQGAGWPLLTPHSMD